MIAVGIVIGIAIASVAFLIGDLWDRHIERLKQSWRP